MRKMIDILRIEMRIGKEREVKEAKHVGVLRHFRDGCEGED